MGEANFYYFTCLKFKNFKGFIELTLQLNLKENDEFQGIPPRHSLHVQAPIPQEWNALCRHLVEGLQDRRYRRHQGRWICPRRHAPQVLPRSDWTRFQRDQPIIGRRRLQASAQPHRKEEDLHPRGARATLELSSGFLGPREAQRHDSS